MANKSGGRKIKAWILEKQTRFEEISESSYGCVLIIEEKKD
jgi:hypothetical protein